MEGIILTLEARDKMYLLINEFYDNSSYGSFENFQSQELRNIVVRELNNGLFLLSITVMTDPIYTDLKEFILNQMTEPLLIREVTEDEIPNNDDF